MEIKDQPLVGKQDKPLRQPADDGPGKTANNLLKQRINNFLINYFGYLSLVLAFIIFVVGLFLFVYPQYQQLAKINETAKKSLQTEFEAKAIYLSAIRDLKNSQPPVSGADRKKIEEMVPVGDEVIGLIPEIESIVLKNGVILDSIRIEGDLKSQVKEKTKVGSGGEKKPSMGIFEQLPEGVGLAKIDINLSSVNYPVLKNLFKTFENNLRLFDIAKINYKVQENKAVFTVYSYYLPD